MFLIQTKVDDQCDSPFCDLLAQIDKKVSKWSLLQLNNIRFGFQSNINYDAFWDLMNYREILIHKIYCSDCFKQYDINNIVAKIRSILNQPC